MYSEQLEQLIKSVIARRTDHTERGLYIYLTSRKTAAMSL